MKGLIKFSLDNPHAIIVLGLTIIVLGVLTLTAVPVDILPVFNSPAVQVLTFYNGMPAEGMEKDITNRMERWTNQGNGMKGQESRSILGASIVRNYFYDNIDPNGALTQVNSLALATLPNLPPGTLPPVVLPYDPTSTTPVAVVALDSPNPNDTESILYDVGRYEVRSKIMQIKGASAPVVIGGQMRAVMLYLNQTEMQARGHSPADIMDAVERFNLFFPAGDIKIGDWDYSLDSNSMFNTVERMGDIPLKTKKGNAEYLRDLAKPRDAAFIQTNIVRVNGKEQVYIPVYRQVGASTLAVVEGLNRKALDKMEGQLSHSDVKLKLAMDQSIYVRESIGALVLEASLGALLCAGVIMLFLGQWRMTLIAILTLPLSVLVAIVCLYLTRNTINVMTLAGLTLAIGPMIDSAIICLENTHRHLGMGANSRMAAMNGASEVAMPELVSTICTFLVLVPLIFIPGTGKFLFLPMTLAVMFAMTTAYILSRTLVPCFSFLLLKPHTHEAPKGRAAQLFAAWERIIDAGILLYVRALNVVLKHRVVTIVGSFLLLAAVLACFAPILRRDFFPEADAGAFEIAVRGPAGLRIERMKDNIKNVETFLTANIGEDLETTISEIGLTADWSAAYTPNSGPQDAIIKVQLTPHRSRSAQYYVKKLRDGFAADKRFSSLEFAFDAGGLVRGALNEGKSTPINIQIRGKNVVRFQLTDESFAGLSAEGVPADMLVKLGALKGKLYSAEKAFLEDLASILNTDEQERFQRHVLIQARHAHVLFEIAEKIKSEVKQIKGIVDARIIQRLDAPELVVEVDRAKAAQMGLTQDYIMKNLIAATNSSITFNKRNFWIDPISHNQYYVGVQYPEKKLEKMEDLLNIPIVTPDQKQPILLKQVATIRPGQVKTEIHHVDLLPAIDLTMGVEGRDLGHVCDEVKKILEKYGTPGDEAGTWLAFDPHSTDHRPLEGAEIVLSGEYSRMESTFKNLGVGLILAALLIYFLMVGLDRSFLVPLTVMLVVPLCLVGVLPFLYLTGSAINVQSLLGIIFIVGIKVANTVLMTDYAQELRRHEGLSPTDAIRKAAGLRVRPVTMTALAALCAMIPTALALEKGSEANAPLARAILGGLLAGEPATLFVLPALYSLMIRDRRKPSGDGHSGQEGTGDHPGDPHAVPNVAEGAYTQAPLPGQKGHQAPGAGPAGTH
jgi:multidrug efflux pump subunit AcrB